MSNEFPWLRALPSGKGPRYQQIADMLGAAITDGQLRPGQKVPAQRQLAELLDVDLTTVTRAYAEAKSRGWLASAAGKGSYVSHACATGDVMSLDLSMNVPPVLPILGFDQLLKHGLDELLTSQSFSQLSCYDAEQSGRSMAASGLEWLAPVMGRIEPGRLVTTAGGQAAIYMVLRHVCKPGDQVITAPWTYPGLLLACQQLGLATVAADVDDEGVIPESVATLCRDSRASLLYLNPTIQNPTATTMSLKRRQALAEVVAQTGIRLLEDDPYWALLETPLPAVSSLRADLQAFYVASLSKCMWPSLRTALLVSPGAADSHAIVDHLAAIGMVGSPLMYALSDLWIRNGVGQQLAASIRRENQARQELARQLLPANAFGHPSGLHVWLPLPAPWTSQLLVRSLGSLGIRVASSESFAVQRMSAQAVRISLSGAADTTQLAVALKKIKALLDDTDQQHGRRVV